jgi:hypothetical protein
MNALNRTKLYECKRTHLRLPLSAFRGTERRAALGELPKNGRGVSVLGAAYYNASQRARNGRYHATYCRHHSDVYTRHEILIDMDPRYVDDPTLFGYEILAKLGMPPTSHHSLDRIDGTRGYWLDNLRWADPYMQAANRTARELGEDL